MFFLFFWTYRVDLSADRTVMVVRSRKTWVTQLTLTKTSSQTLVTECEEQFYFIPSIWSSSHKEITRLTLLNEPGIPYSF